MKLWIVAAAAGVLTAAAGGQDTANLETAYGAIIDALLPGIGHAEELEREQPQRAFEKICLEAGRPGAETRRAALCRAIVARLGAETAQPARVWMLRQVERIGRAEVVGALNGLLEDEDERVRELARRSLQHNPTTQAAQVLRDALAKAQAAPRRAALIHALGARRDAESLTLVIKLSDDADAAVALAAVAALGDIGGDAALRRLEGLWRSNRSELREPAADACLRCADRLMLGGARERAGKVYEDLYNAGPAGSLKIAALRGLAAARGEATLPLLMGLVGGQDASLRAIVAGLLGELAGAGVTNAIVENLGGSPAELHALLIDVLAARGDQTGRAAVIASLIHEEKSVRLAALRALQALGDSTTVLSLARAAGQTTGTEREAARGSLDRLRGEGVDAVMVAALPSAAVPVRVELIRSLGARHFKKAVPVLLKAAAAEDDAVQTAAFEALTDLVELADRAALVTLVVELKSDAPREAAEKALATVCKKVEQEEERAAPVLTALASANGPARASLIRVAGRLGGAQALAAIRAALRSNEADVNDAAVRALAKWESAEVIDDLFQIAENSPDETLRVLGLRGTVRLAKLKSERSADETLALYERALKAARRDDDKKLVLSGLAQVAHLDGLKMVEPFLAVEALRDEAATAMLDIIGKLGPRDRTAALAAVEKVRAAPVGERTKKRLQETQDQLERAETYITDWLGSGPYRQEGKGASELFGIGFAPEMIGAEAMEWTALGGADENAPWKFDLTKVSSDGRFCVYVKTSIWSEREQEATLEVGSDDGVKVWFNQKVVLAKNVLRGLKVGDDKINVTLEKGWNALMLKVVQAGGSSGVACGVSSPDGGKLEGIRFEAR